MPLLHTSPDIPNRHISPFRVACPREGRLRLRRLPPPASKPGGKLLRTRPALSFHTRTASPCAPVHVQIVSRSCGARPFNPASFQPDPHRHAPCKSSVPSPASHVVRVLSASQPCPPLSPVRLASQHMDPSRHAPCSSSDSTPLAGRAVRVSSFFFVLPRIPAPCMSFCCATRCVSFQPCPLSLSAYGSKPPCSVQFFGFHPPRRPARCVSLRSFSFSRILLCMSFCCATRCVSFQPCPLSLSAYGSKPPCSVQFFGFHPPRRPARCVSLRSFSFSRAFRAVHVLLLCNAMRVLSAPFSPIAAAVWSGWPTTSCWRPGAVRSAGRIRPGTTGDM